MHLLVLQFQILVFPFFRARMLAYDTFDRLPESGSVRILPVALWSDVRLRPKFIVVELQLLIQGMKCDEQMHRNYAAMRDKMTN